MSEARTAGERSGWRAVRSAPGQEKGVRYELDRMGLRVYLPIETVFIRPRGKRLEHTRPLIPGYLFADLADEAIGVVRRAPGVRGFVVDGGSPAVIPPAAVERLRAKEAAGGFNHTIKSSEPEALQVGDLVQVSSGAWMGFVGSVERLDPRQRVRLLINVFGRRGPLTIDRKQLELVERPEGVAKAA